jgi:predicted RNA binding protein YcfA (HicA-like mRNA interferase family)
MSRIPTLHVRKFIRALERAGYTPARQSGSHCIYQHPERPSVIVPIHAKDLHRNLMKAIIIQAGFTEDEFLEFL